MRVLLVADFRSPLARGWVEALPPTIDEVVLLSTRRAEPVERPGVLDFRCVQGVVVRAKDALAAKRRSAAGRSAAQLATPRPRRAYKVAAEVAGAWPTAREVRMLSDRYRPAVVHGLRIPFEGIAVGMATSEGNRASPPLAISIWGNDLTLHAARSRWIARLTRSTLSKASGLHADCHRDVTLAADWGLNPNAPSLVVPTNGGLDETVFNADSSIDDGRLAGLGIPSDRVVIVNPRGLRSYIRTDTFLRSIDLVRRSIDDVVGVVVGARNHGPSERLVDELELRRHIVLLPTVPQAALAQLFRVAAVSVSPSTHDGTPNSLLEAMACGAFPVVSDLASTREWIDDGRNGLLFSASDHRGLASQLLVALGDNAFRAKAIEANRHLVATRAARPACVEATAAWYERVAATSA